MIRIRSLTVRQSMILILLSGLLTALIFAGFTFASDLRDRSAMRRDEALLELGRGLGDLVHALQREREGTSLALLMPDLPDRPDLARRRAETDAVVSRLLDEPTSARLRIISADPALVTRLADGLRTLRADIDNGSVGAAQQAEEITTTAARLIGALSNGLNHARSPALIRHMRTALTLMRVKGDAGHQKVRGLQLLSGRDAPALHVAFVEGLGQERAGLEIFRTQAAPASGSDLSLSERIPAVVQLFQWQDNLARGTGPLPSRGAWIAASARWIDALRRVETSETARMWAEVHDEVRGANARIGGRLALLAGLIAVFGGAGLMAMRSVGTSVTSIIRAICRLTVDAQGATIPACPQKDLNQISRALRVLRAAQMNRENSHLETERRRSRFDAEVDEMLRSVSKGHRGRRLDVLGLDSANAVLARGINDLLDQIERRNTA